MTENDIIKICEKYNIQNYTINSDMSIDVAGSVYLVGKQFKKLPVNFNKVSGNFECGFGKLTTLKGCPKYVGGNFICSYSMFTSLEHIPVNFYVGGRFIRRRPEFQIEPYEFRYLFFGTIIGEIALSDDDLNEFFNKYKNPPKKDLPKLLSDLKKMIV